MGEWYEIELYLNKTGNTQAASGRVCTQTYSSEGDKSPSVPVGAVWSLILFTLTVYTLSIWGLFIILLQLVSNS